MNTKELQLAQTDVHKLLACANGDAVLLHLYLLCGNPPQEAAASLGLSQPRYATAAATLRQMGLWPEEPTFLQPDRQPPSYTEEDVTQALGGNDGFRLLVGEVQRTLGRILTTEELKILLSFLHYLGLPPEVVSMLVCYCKERLRRKGSSRNPSLRMIEKEAYAWAEQGVTTLEEAAAYLQTQNARHTRLAELMRLLQISGRSLTPAEERYAQTWLDLDFDSEALQMAYEKTCLNTGGLKWPYMNKILLSWHQQGLHTGAQVRGGDKKPAPQRQRVQQGTAALGQMEKEAIARLLREQGEG